MRGLHEIKEMLCKELEEYARKGELSAGSLDALHKLTDTIKNIDKIEMLEGGGYSRDGSYDSYGDDDSYRRGYSRDAAYRRGGSYDSYDGGDSYRRGYSREGGKEQMVRKMEEMLRYVDNEEQRKAVERCIHQLKEG